MIIGVTGYGDTGASAVIDYMKGYDNVFVFDKTEFQLLHMPDGILDLKYHLCQNRDRITCNAAIKRFKKAAMYSSFARKMTKSCGDRYLKITKDYIDSLIMVKWDGKSAYDPGDVTNISRKKFVFYTQILLNGVLKRINRKWHFPPYQERYFALMEPSHFDAVTKSYMSKLIALMNCDNCEIVILEMLTSAITPGSGLEFFDDARVLVVDRDPRDNFMACLFSNSGNAFMPIKNCADFCIYYKTLRDMTVLPDKVLKIRYEDLIYKYYQTTDNINRFLGIDSRPTHEFVYFNPDISVKYTNLEQNKAAQKENMEYIKVRLDQYLYDFKEYVPVEKQKHIEETQI